MEINNKGNGMNKLNTNKSRTDKAAADLLNDGKKFASALYEDGSDKITDVEDNIKEYSDQLLKKVQENPLAAMILSVGVGFVLSRLLRK